MRINPVHRDFLAIYLLAFALSFSCLALADPHSAFAASVAVGSGTPVAVSVTIEDAHLSYGDIVSYDEKHALYSLSHKADDLNLFGVVAQSPPLVFVADDTTVPVVRSGRALVNVTLENGPIRVGDFITSSSLPGKGQRATAQNSRLVGAAVVAFTGAGGVEAALPNGKRVGSGTIAVDVDVVGSLGNTGNANIAQADEKAAMILGVDTETMFAIMHYVLAAAITLGSLYLAFRSFMSDANYGVISIGRNPRARSSIQAMVLFNAFLAVLIAGAGIFVAMIVLFV
ncbi:hypothetical protein A2851_02660 [Candidatus Kaiserbacteria bacterium RIFCSPHIGHO2_01_FULL_53_29]|uniref:ABC transporter permease n=1 Tax=Candidatus Kaiserbacteria bacterium RIFCSPHIGHO2_01_FULL_53_29 TaxID=1798480 RepID=A0A1F6CY52_9BACT|nr:MAG: hypothetical protein A2851_02660 [Candidatus Kaiserbacteria bacterium RIFCSPHIGHO2_01_FULL_53_29]